MHLKKSQKQAMPLKVQTANPIENKSIIPFFKLILLLTSTLYANSVPKKKHVMYILVKQNNAINQEVKGEEYTFSK